MINNIHYQCRLSNITKHLSNTMLPTPSSSLSDAGYLTNISHDISNLSLSNPYYNPTHIPTNYMNYASMMKEPSFGYICPNPNLMMRIQPVAVNPPHTHRLDTTTTIRNHLAYNSNSYILSKPAMVYIPQLQPQLHMVLTHNESVSDSIGMQVPTSTEYVVNTTPTISSYKPNIKYRKYQNQEK